MTSVANIHPRASWRERALLLILLLIAPAALKIWFHPELGIGADDAAFFYQVARHVQESGRLETSVSLYHQTLHDLPRETAIYPLWPLLLGWAARLFTLDGAARLLPEITFFLSLVILYFFTNRLVREVIGGGAETIGGTALTAGHVAVLLLAFNPIYFLSTSTPNPDGLGLILYLLALLAVAKAEKDGGRWAAAAGALAGAAYLCRYQFFIVPIVIAGALWYSRRHADGKRLGGIAAIASAALMIPWHLYVAAIVPRWTPALILDFSAQRDRTAVPPMQWMVPTSGVFDTALDRVRGLAVAFSPANPDSYISSFGPIAYAVPLALLLLIARRKGAGERPPISAFALASMTSASVLVFLVHLFHQRMFNAWLFGQRHGLYLLIIIIWAAAYLAAYGGRVVAALTLAFMIWSLTASAVTIVRTIDRGWPQKPSMETRAFAVWADSRKPKPTIISTRPQVLSALSRANYHWIACVDPPETLRLLQREVEADYVVVFPIDERCSFLEGWERDFAEVTVIERTERVRILQPRVPALREAGPETAEQRRAPQL